MARPEPTAAAAAITIAVIGIDSGCYEMFDVVAATGDGATLRGPLLLELGERLNLRLSRGDQSVDVIARVGNVKRGDGHSEPTIDVIFEDGAAARLVPIVG